jgi:hypothetical protein
MWKAPFINGAFHISVYLSCLLTLVAVTRANLGCEGSMRSPHQRPEAPDGLPVKTIRFEACRSYKPLETPSRLLVNRGNLTFLEKIGREMCLATRSNGYGLIGS